MRRALTDRGAGVALVVLGSAAVFAATGFRAGFIADPIGPRAFPLGIFGLTAVLGVVLLVTGTKEAAIDKAVARRAVWLGASLLAYVVLLSSFGFLLTTTVEMTLLGVLFGERPLRSLVASFLTTIALFALFVYGFAVPLPIGTLFTSGAG